MENINLFLNDKNINKNTYGEKNENAHLNQLRINANVL